MPSSPNKKVLLIAHEGTRSGAPILLLTLARWLVRHTDLAFEVLLLRDGPLRNDFASLVPTMVLDELSGRKHRAARWLHRLMRRDASHWDERALRKLVGRGYSVVFGNSIVCLPWTARFRTATTARCICAVHELSWTIGRFFEQAYVEKTLPTMHRVVAGSRAVRDNLVANYHTPTELIDVIHSFVDDELTLRRTPEALRRELGIREEDVVVGAVGNAELRKGTDLFVPIAMALKHRNSNRRFRFVWLGTRPGDEMASLCRRDAAVLGMSEDVIFVDANPDANDYLNLCDVFVLPSREDPFPLVVLSAIRLGKPVVAFERSGGMDELLIGGAGRLVPYLDIQRFAEAIDDLANDVKARSAVVATARARVAADYGVDRLARRLQETIVSTEGTGAAAGHTMPGA